jgi:hypothetical protein
MKTEFRRAAPSAALCAALLFVAAPSVAPAEDAVFALPPGWTESSYPPLPRARWQALPYPALWAVEDRTGRIWLGAPPPRHDGPGDDALVARVKRNVEAAFRAERPLAWGAEFVRFDGAGRVWAVARGQAFHVLGYDGRRWLEVPLAIPAAGRNRFAPGDLYEDAKGRVWFRGIDQVCRLEDGRFIGMPVPVDPETAGDRDQNVVGERPLPMGGQPSFVGSSDGLILIEAWSRERTRWFFRDGNLFRLTHPLPGGGASGHGCWPMSGGRIYFAGCPPRKAILTLDGRDDEERQMGGVILRLGDDRFEVREKATQEILRRFFSYRVRLEAERDKAEDPEIRQRLQFVLDTLDQTPIDGECWDEADGPWILSGDFTGAPPRGPGFVATLSLRMPGRDKGVFWDDGTGARVRLPVPVGEENTKLDFDGAGRPLVAGGNAGSFRMAGGRFERATPEAWDAVVRRLHAVDREGRAFFSVAGGDALFLHDPSAPERPRDGPAWAVRGRADWLAADSLGRVWAGLSEPEELRGLGRVAGGGAWETVRVHGQPLRASRLVARGTGGAMLFHAEWKEPSEEPAPADRRGICLVGAGEPRFADTLSAFGRAHGDVLRERFAASPRGLADNAGLAADGGGRVWYVERAGSGRDEIFTADASGEMPVALAIALAFPACQDARAVLGVPGGGPVVALFRAPAPDVPLPAPLALGWEEGRPSVRELGPRGGAAGPVRADALFVAGDGTVFVGAVDRPGVVRVRGGGAAERGDGRMPLLEHPDGTFWSVETARSGDGIVAPLALVAEIGGAGVRLPLGSPGPWAPPVADAKGRVWIGLADRALAVRLDGGALRVEREAFWDRPGRRVQRLHPDAEGRLWAWDAGTNEVLSLEPAP